MKFEESHPDAESHEARKLEAYQTWLKVPAEECPPNYYQLLGLELYEADKRIIHEAAQKRVTHLKSLCHGKPTKLILDLVQEIKLANHVLITPEEKSDYDDKLQSLLGVSELNPVNPKPQNRLRKLQRLKKLKKLKKLRKLRTVPEPKLTEISELKAATVSKPQAAEISELKTTKVAEPQMEEISELKSAEVSEPRVVEESPDGAAKTRKRQRSLLPMIGGAALGPVTVLGGLWLFGGFDEVPPRKTRSNNQVVENAVPHEDESAPSNGPRQTLSKSFVPNDPLPLPPENTPPVIDPNPAPPDDANPPDANPPDGVPVYTVSRIDSLDELAGVDPIEIPANQAIGCRVRPLQAGAFLLLQYVDGTWSRQAGAAGESPDAEQITPTGSRLVITPVTALGAAAQKTTVLPGTQDTPFISQIDGAVTEWQLGMEGDPAGFADRAGSVQYRIAQILPREIVPSSNPPVPSLVLQRPAKAKIRGIFRDDFAAAVTLEKARELADKFLKESRATNDPVIRYVFLDEARELALHSGELDLALNVIQRIAQNYQVDELAERGMAIREIARRLRTDKEARKIERYYRETINSLLKQQQFDDAVLMANDLSSLAMRVRDTDLRQVARDLRTDILAQKKQQVDAVTIQRLLEDGAEEPKDQLLLGKHWAFKNGDWEKGLPYLAQGSDAKLKLLAEQDLAKPKEPEPQEQLADAWRDYAVSRPNSREKSAILRRAADWYLRAEAQMAGLDRIRVSEQLRQLDEIDDLLKVIDPAVVVKHGNWKLANGLLTSPQGAWSRIQAHYIPAAEYRVTLNAKWLDHENQAVDGRDAVLIGLSHAGRQFMVAVDWETPEATQPFATGFIELDQKLSWSPPTPYCHQSPAVLVRGQDNTIDVFVKKSGVTVEVNGKPLVKYGEGYDRLQLGTWFAGVDPKKLFIGTHHASYQFSRFEVRRIVPELE